jgi:Cu2+-exporting ATPase
MIAIAVLIITCPCALALAVPMVHVVAAKRLFDERIVIKDGSALERLATVDAVIFDKTGTLTTGRPRLVSQSDPDTNSLAATIAAHSRHPYAEAFAGLHTSDCKISFDTVSEYPGMGLEAALGADVYRFGRPDWAVAERRSDAADDEVPVVLSVNGTCMARFHLDDILRSGASEAIADLTALGIDVSILSGDTDKRVRSIAMQCGLPYTSGARPDDKVRQIAAQKAAGKKILMVGDGLNDAPALLAADVSMAPASAADIGRNAADFVFLRDSLSAVPQAVSVARKASARVRQNFALAIAYNIVAIPIAVFGHVTPLLAAVAMSLSSTAVVANALRPYPGQAARRCGTDIGRASPPASPVRGAAI